MSTRHSPASPEEFAVMARRAGLAWDEAELEELRQGYNHLIKWLAMLDGGWGDGDEPAHAFSPSGRAE